MTINSRQLVDWFVQNRGRFVTDIRLLLLRPVEAIQKKALEKAQERNKCLGQMQQDLQQHQYDGWDLSVRISVPDHLYRRVLGRIEIKKTLCGSGYEGELTPPGFLVLNY